MSKKDYKAEHEILRRKCWIEILVATAASSATRYSVAIGHSVAIDWADRALEDFDRRFHRMGADSDWEDIASDALRELNKANSSLPDDMKSGGFDPEEPSLSECISQLVSDLEEGKRLARRFISIEDRQWVSRCGAVPDDQIDSREELARWSGLSESEGSGDKEDNREENA